MARPPIPVRPGRRPVKDRVPAHVLDRLVERFPMIDPDSTEPGLHPFGQTVAQHKLAIAAIRNKNRERGNNG